MSTHCLLLSSLSLTLCLLLLPTTVVSQSSSLVVKDCTASQYFDYTSLQCYECVDGTEAQSANKMPDFTTTDPYGNAISCTCQPGYIEVRTAAGSGNGQSVLQIAPKFTCVQCPVDEAPTQDKTTCLPCTAFSTTVNNVLSITSSQATSPTATTLTHGATTSDLVVGDVVTVTGHTGDAANVAMNQIFKVATVTSSTITVLTGTGMTIGTYNTGTISGTVTKTPSDGSIFSITTKECSCGTTNGEFFLFKIKNNIFFLFF